MCVHWTKISFILLVLAVLVVCYWQLSPTAQTRTAPDFALPSPHHEGRITLRRYRGQVVVVNFFATWCTRCRAEKKFLRALRDTYRALPIISILTFDAEADQRTLPASIVAIDGDGAVARSYGVRWLPQTFLIDAEGHIVQHFPQPLNPRRYELLRTRITAMRNINTAH